MEFQGKGNKTKKTKNGNQAPLLDFDFEGQMKSFMEKSTNNQMFKPLVDTVNTVSNIDNLKNNVTNNVTNNLKQSIEKEITQKFPEPKQLVTNIETNLKSDIESIIDDNIPKPTPPPINKPPPIQENTTTSQ